MKIAFSGPRKLTKNEVNQVLVLLPTNPEAVAVGDAKGLDALVVENYTGKTDITMYHVEGRERWQYAARSQRMINDATALIAFPNKPCPDICTPAKPFSGHGSGTWGTIAYAIKKGIPVTIHALDGTQPPSWTHQQQLALI
ncbi:hypothetical protein [Picosynechococcus sp. NKBG15041c]|uniref:hypothetical protein n=1 Tax=Picosynechococcus sp. NKBG15041c TaxID=1407650 RepID=UPI00040AC096|nr:hypothetical protein [Picosynechococcus sp. NKBG15041c]